MLEALSFFNVFLIVYILKHPCSSVFFLSLKKNQYVTALYIITCNVFINIISKDLAIININYLEM